MVLHVAHISMSPHGRLLQLAGSSWLMAFPCMLENDTVKLQHNAVAAERLVVHMPVCTAMAHTAATITSQGCWIPTD